MSKTLNQIASILCDERKINTYKFALIRAVADVCIGFEFTDREWTARNRAIFIPLDYLAYKWIAYYWPFMANEGREGIYQSRQQTTTQDMTFRRSLESLKRTYQRNGEQVDPVTDGYQFSDRTNEAVQGRYGHEVKAILADIKRGLNQPIRYAHGGTGGSFFRKERDGLVIDKTAYNTIRAHSQYVEALSISAWAEWLGSRDRFRISTGKAYTLLTKKPDARIGIQTYRNLFTENPVCCTYCYRPLEGMGNRSLEMDHVIPVSIYPVNDLWNLWPVCNQCNSSTGKSNRIPTIAGLKTSISNIERTFQVYMDSPFNRLFREQFEYRFGLAIHRDLSEAIVKTIRFIDSFATARNVNRWEPPFLMYKCRIC